MRVELRDEARNDLVDGAWFYGRQSPRLDDYFIECLHKDLRNLETTFGIHERYRGFFRKLSRRFPYAIYYLLTDDMVDVVAILDCRSEPRSIDARLGRTMR
jgi:plasmid stabilization system protein ParE